MATASTTSTSPIRLVVQSVTSARLQVEAPAAAAGAEGRWASIGPGTLVFVSFLRGCQPTDLPARVTALLAMRLVPSYVGGQAKGQVSLAEAGRDLLLIPQACIAGKRKGKAIQYHGLVGREEGQALYAAFVEEVRRQTAPHGIKVECGTFGNLQALSLTSQGPFTHVLDDL